MTGDDRLHFQQFDERSAAREQAVTLEERLFLERLELHVLRQGVDHLIHSAGPLTVVPLALEYTFWTERTPEALVRVGEPLRVADHPGLTGKAWTALIEAALTANLDALNAETIRRDPAAFAELLTGKTGVGGVYDLWRRLKAWARGRRFDPSHEAATREAKP